MNWYRLYKDAQQLFRGDPKPLKLEDYDPEHGINEMGKELGGSMSYGPGMYFTNKENYARYYGQNVTQRNLTNAKIIDEKSPKLTYQQIVKILRQVEKQRLETAISNWSENFNEGFQMLAKAITDNNDPINQLMSIWADVFYHQNAKEFIDLMVKNGIDGISWQVNKDDPKYRDAINYVIYNRNILS